MKRAARLVSAAVVVWTCTTGAPGDVGAARHPGGSVHVLQVDERSAEVWLLLRIGYCRTPPRSLRRPIAEVMI